MIKLRIEFGAFSLVALGNGNYMLQREDGEAMEISEIQIAIIFEKYFIEKF